MKNASYRKHNDRTDNSSTYHKKDGTNIRAILKREAEEEMKNAMTTTTTTVPRYVVLTAAAHMPNSCWGRYGKVAVVETDGKGMPCRIDERLNCVKRIVEIWDRQNIGITDRCAFARAKREAEELANRLNALAETEGGD